MLSILIVDDEEFMREYLGSLEWNKLGFEKVQIVKDGKEALDVLDNFQGEIDLLLTDIKMPFIDGLELCKIVAEKYPLVYKVILTGYDEFEYAQKAIKYGVKEYILKPVTPNDLYEIIEKIKSQLTEEKEKLRYYRQIEAMFEENKPFLKERFILRLIKGASNTKEIRKIAKYYNVNIEGSKFVVAILSPVFENEEDMGMEKEILEFAISDLVKKEVSYENVYITADSDNNLLFLFVDFSVGRIKCIFQSVVEKVKDAFGVPIFVSVGKEVTSIESLVVSYKTALNGQKYKFLIEDVEIVDYEELISEAENNSFIDYNCELEKLIWEIKVGNKDSIRNELYKLFEKIKQVKTIEVIKLVAIDIIVEIFKLYSSISGGSTNLGGYLQKLEKKEINISEIKRLCFDLAEKINEELQLKVKSKHYRLIEKVKEIIKGKFMDPTLNLSYVANELHISLNYLSSVFKKETGQSFVQYLTNFRIDKAKELLRTTDLKTYEIAFEVGYEDSQYFSTVFKKIVGVSPSEYREMVKNEK